MGIDQGSDRLPALVRPESEVFDLHDRTRAEILKALRQVITGFALPSRLRRIRGGRAIFPPGVERLACRFDQKNGDSR